MNDAFRMTALGHHGWLFEAADARILVDPLLHDAFGLTPAVGLRVFPPRRVDVSALPALDAVMLTHEHEGHFDLASLHCLDRSVPIYMSSRSSVAMRTILAEMGFGVRLLNPDEGVTVGGLEFLPMSADQRRDAIIEEWDVLPYLVRDLAGHGSFFTSVDMPATQDMLERVRARVDRVGVWGQTNNWSEWHFLTSWSGPHPEEIATFVQSAIGICEWLDANHRMPAAWAVVGGGFCFGGDRAWLNGNAFTTDGRAHALALEPLLPANRVCWPRPGDTYVMIDGELVEQAHGTPFLSASPEDEWPARTFVGDVEWLEDYDAATSQASLSDEELDALDVELRSLAAHLYGRDLFKDLYSLGALDDAQTRPTFALALRDGEDDGAFVYAYEPQRSTFVAVDSGDPVSDYVAVFECWARDLLAFLRCEVSSATLTFGRCRVWNAIPDRLAFDLPGALLEYVHPLRHPERWLATYRRYVRELPQGART